MGKNVGLDFGTTYSVVADLVSPETGDFTPQSVNLVGEGNNNSNYYRTLVVRKKKDNAEDKLIYGKKINQDELGNKGTITYRGFKLLLAESEKSAELEKAGYTDGYTPKVITQKYIRYLLELYKARPEGGPIDNLVICVPDIWARGDLGAYNLCYKRLLEAVEELNIASHIDEFLSEPEAACSYYVSNYQKNNGIIYEGYLLLIDYGGGTLDITLCKVVNDDGKPVIDVIHREGAGENTTGRIGEAGLAFMTEVIRLTLLDFGITDEKYEEYKRRGSIDKAVLNLDMELQNFSRKPDDEVQERTFKDAFKDIDEERLKGIIKRNKSNLFEDFPIRVPDKIDPLNCNISYKNIAKAYQAVIFDTLNKHLFGEGEYIGMMKWIENHQGKKEENIDLTDLTNTLFDSDNFKVQLIGGFCNFYPVEQQIRKGLGLSLNVQEKANNDKRFSDELKGEDKTLAVAYGAAIKANDRVEFIKKWTCKIGLKIKSNENEKPSFCWAVNIDDERVENKIYLMKIGSGKKAFPARGDVVKELYYAGPLDDVGKPKKRKIDSVKFDPNHMNGYVMGISMDRYKVITLHWWKISESLRNRENFDKRCYEFEDDINAGREIPEFDMTGSGNMSIGYVLSGELEGAM